MTQLGLVQPVLALRPRRADSNFSPAAAIIRRGFAQFQTFFVRRRVQLPPALPRRSPAITTLVDAWHGYEPRPKTPGTFSGAHLHTPARASTRKATNEHTAPLGLVPSWL